MWACLTVGGVFDPAESNGAVSVTLTESQQESSRSFIIEQGLSALLSNKSHNAPVTERERQRQNTLKLKKKKSADKCEQETVCVYNESEGPKGVNQDRIGLDVTPLTP